MRGTLSSYLHAAALNLLARLRQEIADPPPLPTESVPAEALAGAERGGINDSGASATR